jgi:signal transduction histidine kinase
VRSSPQPAARPVADAVAATVVIGFFWMLPFDSAAHGARVLAGSALVVATGAAMIARRRLPFTATVTAAIATLAGTALGVCQDPMLATAWCLYPLAVRHAARAGRAGLVPAGLLGALALVTAVPAGLGRGAGERIVLAVAALGVAWMLGTVVGRQIVAARAAERARVQLEVARDVHDVVGHALGVIRAEAGVTLTFADAGEPELRATLAGVESHARAALEEVQALVRSLRDPGAGEPPEPGRLCSVVSATRAAGVRVDARIEGRVGTVAFRIVQEALSNVVRHAPGAACTVDVRERGGALLVRVHDDGRRSPAAGPGRPGVGLRGMRERAAQVGGTVTWGPVPGGGFEVNARLPVREAR